MKDKKDKSPAKFIGALGGLRGILGGAGDVIANRRAAKEAGQDYSFRQGLGDFVQGGISGIVGVGPTVNRAGTPTRDFQPQDMTFPGNMSSSQMEQMMKFFQMAQNMPQSPATKTEKEVVYQTKSVGDKPTERRNNAQELEGKKPGGTEQPKNTTYMSMLPEIEIKTPAKNTGKAVKKMKRAAVKEDQAKIKAKRKAGTLDSSDFANKPYRTLKGKF